MKLISLRIPKKKKKDMPEAVTAYEGDRYPWGLRISMNKDEIKKLNASGLNAGDMVKIVATGKVIEKRVSDEVPDKRSEHISIQIQTMGFTNKSDFAGAFKEASK